VSVRVCGGGADEEGGGVMIDPRIFPGEERNEREAKLRRTAAASRGIIEIARDAATKGVRASSLQRTPGRGRASALLFLSSTPPPHPCHPPPGPCPLAAVGALPRNPRIIPEHFALASASDNKSRPRDTGAGGVLKKSRGSSVCPQANVFP
jgi:hypothetical protein